jgi:hypothetical protein
VLDEGIAQWQQMPTIILFNPQIVSVELLDREFHREISSIDSLLSDDEIERSREIVTEISESAGGNVGDAAAWKRSTAIVSCDYLGHRNMNLPANDAGSLIGRRISVDVEHVDLLRSASAAQQVLTILGVAPCSLP